MEKLRPRAASPPSPQCGPVTALPRLAPAGTDRPVRRQQGQGPEGEGGVLGRTDREQLCVLGPDWERKGLEGPQAGGWPYPLAPILFCQHLVTPNQRVTHGATSPLSCVAMDNKSKICWFPAPSVWGRGWSHFVLSTPTLQVRKLRLEEARGGLSKSFVYLFSRSPERPAQVLALEALPVHRGYAGSWAIQEGLLEEVALGPEEHQQIPAHHTQATPQTSQGALNTEACFLPQGPCCALPNPPKAPPAPDRPKLPPLPLPAHSPDPAPSCKLRELELHLPGTLRPDLMPPKHVVLTVPRTLDVPRTFESFSAQWAMVNIQVLGAEFESQLIHPHLADPRHARWGQRHWHEGVLGGGSETLEGSFWRQPVNCGIAALPPWRGVQGPREDCGGPSTGDMAEAAHQAEGTTAQRLWTRLRARGQEQPWKPLRCPREAGRGRRALLSTSCGPRGEVRGEPGWQGALPGTRQEPHIKTCVAIRAKISAKGSQMVKREAGLRGVEPRRKSPGHGGDLDSTGATWDLLGNQGQSGPLAETGSGLSKGPAVPGWNKQRLRLAEGHPVEGTGISRCSVYPQSDCTQTPGPEMSTPARSCPCLGLEPVDLPLIPSSDRCPRHLQRGKAGPVLHACPSWLLIWELQMNLGSWAKLPGCCPGLRSGSLAALPQRTHRDGGVGSREAKEMLGCTLTCKGRAVSAAGTPRPSVGKYWRPEAPGLGLTPKAARKVAGHDLPLWVWRIGVATRLDREGARSGAGSSDFGKDAHPPLREDSLGLGAWQSAWGDPGLSAEVGGRPGQASFRREARGLGTAVSAPSCGGVCRRFPPYLQLQHQLMSTKGVGGGGESTARRAARWVGFQEEVSALLSWEDGWDQFQAGLGTLVGTKGLGHGPRPTGSAGLAQGFTRQRERWMPLCAWLSVPPPPHQAHQDAHSLMGEAPWAGPRLEEAQGAGRGTPRRDTKPVRRKRCLPEELRLGGGVLKKGGEGGAGAAWAQAQQLEGTWRAPGASLTQKGPPHRLLRASCFAQGRPCPGRRSILPPTHPQRVLELQACAPGGVRGERLPSCWSPPPPLHSGHTCTRCSVSVRPTTALALVAEALCSPSGILIHKIRIFPLHDDRRVQMSLPVPSHCRPPERGREAGIFQAGYAWSSLVGSKFPTLRVQLGLSQSFTHPLTFTNVSAKPLLPNPRLVGRPSQILIPARLDPALNRPVRTRNTAISSLSLTSNQLGNPRKSCQQKSQLRAEGPFAGPWLWAHARRPGSSPGLSLQAAVFLRVNRRGRSCTQLCTEVMHMGLLEAAERRCSCPSLPGRELRLREVKSTPRPQPATSAGDCYCLNTPHNTLHPQRVTSSPSFLGSLDRPSLGQQAGWRRGRRGPAGAQGAESVDRVGGHLAEGAGGPPGGHTLDQQIRGLGSPSQGASRSPGAQAEEPMGSRDRAGGSSLRLWGAPAQLPPCPQEGRAVDGGFGAHLHRLTQGPEAACGGGVRWGGWRRSCHTDRSWRSDLSRGRGEGAQADVPGPGFSATTPRVIMFLDCGSVCDQAGAHGCLRSGATPGAEASMCFADILCSYLSSFWGVLHAHPPATGVPRACSAAGTPKPWRAAGQRARLPLGVSWVAAPGPASSWTISKEALCDVYDLSLTLLAPGPSSWFAEASCFSRPRPPREFLGPAAHQPRGASLVASPCAPLAPTEGLSTRFPLTSYIPKLPFDHTHPPSSVTEGTPPELAWTHLCRGPAAPDPLPQLESCLRPFWTREGDHVPCLGLPPGQVGTRTSARKSSPAVPTSQGNLLPRGCLLPEARGSRQSGRPTSLPSGHQERGGRLPPPAGWGGHTLPRDPPPRPTDCGHRAGPGRKHGVIYITHPPCPWPSKPAHGASEPAKVAASQSWEETGVARGHDSDHIPASWEGPFEDPRPGIDLVPAWRRGEPMGVCVWGQRAGVDHGRALSEQNCGHWALLLCSATSSAALQASFCQSSTWQVQGGRAKARRQECWARWGSAPGQGSNNPRQTPSPLQAQGARGHCHALRVYTGPSAVRPPMPRVAGVIDVLFHRFALRTGAACCLPGCGCVMTCHGVIFLAGLVLKGLALRRQSLTPSTWCDRLLVGLSLPTRFAVFYGAPRLSALRPPHVLSETSSNMHCSILFLTCILLGPLPGHRAARGSRRWRQPACARAVCARVWLAAAPHRRAVLRVLALTVLEFTAAAAGHQAVTGRIRARVTARPAAPGARPRAPADAAHVLLHLISLLHAFHARPGGVELWPDPCGYHVAVTLSTASTAAWNPSFYCFVTSSFRPPSVASSPSSCDVVSMHRAKGSGHHHILGARPRALHADLANGPEGLVGRTRRGPWARTIWAYQVRAAQTSARPRWQIGSTLINWGWLPEAPSPPHPTPPDREQGQKGMIPLRHLVNLTKRQHDTMECLRKRVVSGLNSYKGEAVFRPFTTQGGKVVGGAEGHVQVPRLGDDQATGSPPPQSLGSPADWLIMLPGLSWEGAISLAWALVTSLSWTLRFHLSSFQLPSAEHPGHLQPPASTSYVANATDHSLTLSTEKSPTAQWLQAEYPAPKFRALRSQCENRYCKNITICKNTAGAHGVSFLGPRTLWAGRAGMLEPKKIRNSRLAQYGGGEGPQPRAASWDPELKKERCGCQDQDNHPGASSQPPQLREGVAHQDPELHRAEEEPALMKGGHGADCAEKPEQQQYQARGAAVTRFSGRSLRQSSALPACKPPRGHTEQGREGQVRGWPSPGFSENPFSSSKEGDQHEAGQMLMGPSVAGPRLPKPPPMPTREIPLPPGFLWDWEGLGMKDPTESFHHPSLGGEPHTSESQVRWPMKNPHWVAYSPLSTLPLLSLSFLQQGGTQPWPVWVPISSDTGSLLLKAAPPTRVLLYQGTRPRRLRGWDWGCPVSPWGTEPGGGPCVPLPTHRPVERQGAPQERLMCRGFAQCWGQVWPLKECGSGLWSSSRVAAQTAEWRVLPELVPALPAQGENTDMKLPGPLPIIHGPGKHRVEGPAPCTGLITPAVWHLRGRRIWR
ncbi:G-protein coupled receptor 20 [Camelus dromedarius]|uniref:G-protein coupled receptor 20 n=1 Tax=Camelus dromedarius TaxID=9838 RepID=A0A5N4CGS9_CAMDR|nr:G-protein coupled receptor 20 [Camelus dromedarius]